METDSKYYVGRAGTMGNRPGNFAVQNSDLVIAIGNRLNIYQVGYQLESWAREAYIIDVDIDELLAAGGEYKKLHEAQNRFYVSV